MTPLVRDFSDADVEAACAIASELFPDYPPNDPADWRHRDATRDPKVKHRRWAVDCDGRLAAFGRYTQSTECYDPRKFIVDVAVRPACQGRGIGSLLFQILVEALGEHDPEALYTHCREDYPHSVRFLERRGFSESMREWESRLPLQEFDPAPHAGSIRRIEAEGLRLRTFAELSDDPRRNDKTCELLNSIREDVPSTVAPTPKPTERWEQESLSDPRHDPENWLLAVDGDRYAGITQLRVTTDPGVLDTGYTGVHRDYRRRGIATALKVAMLTRARDRGYRSVITWNATTNAGMLGINQALGFIRQPAWIEFERRLEPKCD